MFLKKYANLYRFKPYFARQKGLTVLLLVCMLTASTMGVVLSYLSSQQLIAISNSALREMVKFASLIIAVVLVHHTTWFLWDKISAIIGNRVASEIRRDIFIDTINTKYQTVRENSAGYYLERLNDDTNEISYFVQNVLGTLVDVFTNVSFLVIIFFQNWQCALLFTLGIVGLYLIDLWKIRVELKHTKKMKLLNEALDSKMTETIRGIRDIKGLGIRDEVVRQNEEISRKLARESARMKSDVAFWSRVRTFGQWLIDAMIVWMCAFWLLPTGQITAVVILILFNYKGLMYDTISCLSMLKSYYVQGDFKASRILEVFDNPQKECFGSAVLNDCRPTVEVRHLTFAYEDREVLHDVSFRLEPGTASVLLGASASGKSTLFSLITKLNDVGDGQIFINGFDINAIDGQSLTSHVSIVNQEPFVFSDTIANNLRIVKPGASDGELFAACRKANIYQEILQMKDGFDTVLTDNGSNLSGGQKQRLSIARAILKDTPIILFDEPTSALDRENQALFLQTLRELKADKTLFVIAHKINDLSLFDQVLEMQDGRISACSCARG